METDLCLLIQRPGSELSDSMSLKQLTLVFHPATRCHPVSGFSPDVCTLQVDQRHVFERAHLLLAGSYISKKKFDLAQDMCRKVMVLCWSW